MSQGRLVECSFLVPTRGDADLSDGALHSVTEWEWLTEELWQRFGGGTSAPGFYAGFYSDPDTGQRVSDESRRFIVAVDESRVEELRDLLREACITFHQKMIYLSIAGEVEFIPRSGS